MFENQNRTPTTGSFVARPSGGLRGFPGRATPLRAVRSFSSRRRPNPPLPRALLAHSNGPSRPPVASGSPRASRRYAAAARRCSTRRERCHRAYHLPDAHNDQCQDSGLGRFEGTPPLDKVIPPATGITLPSGQLHCCAKFMLLSSQEAVEQPSRSSTISAHLGRVRAARTAGMVLELLNVKR